MTRVLVTGGQGFIGSHTVDRLVAEGYRVRSLDNLERQVHLGKRPDSPVRGVEYLRGDIRNSSHWRKALKGVESVIHLAGAVGVAQSFWQARKYVSVNSVGTATLFELLIRDPTLRKSVQKVVVASSKSLYGEGSYSCRTDGEVYPGVRPVDQLKRRDWEVRCPVCGKVVEPIAIREEKPAQNLSPYALSKYDAERLSLDYSYALSLPLVAFRYFNVYGPRQSLSNPYTGVLAIFLSRFLNGKAPVVFEDGRQSRDFVFVKDVARLNTQALSRGQGVYNLGSGRRLSLLEVLQSMKKELGTEIETEITEQFRVGDTRHDFADLTRLERDFGSTRFRLFAEGLKSLIEWSQQVDARDYFQRQERERRAYLSQIQPDRSGPGLIGSR
jgi:dTDP-L-rhamnose 4-epimerase